MADHKHAHSVLEACESVQHLRSLMFELDRKDVIPNLHAMRIYIQQCCVKSATFEAEELCFQAATLGLEMMEKHGCRFEVSLVVEIALQISLRASMASVDPFVRKLVRTSLPHLSKRESRFVERHLIFALAERKDTTIESLNNANPFAESDIQIDWASSTAQEFHLYNVIDGGKKIYKPCEGYGFAKKGLTALLSIDHDPASVLSKGYRRQRDGAIVDVWSAKEDEPLVVRVRTQVAVPLDGGYYRLDNLDISEVPIKRMMETMKILGRDSHPQYGRRLPNASLCEVLFLPAEEAYSAHLVLRAKGADAAPLVELDLCEYSAEPIRVKSIGSGPLLQWNRSHPNKLIHIGDRVASINDYTTKDEMLEELRFAHTWSKYDLRITFMKKVKIQDHGLEDDANALLPNSGEIFDALGKHEAELRKKLNKSQVAAIRGACTRRLSLIQGPPGTGKTTTSVELLDFLLSNKLVPTPILVSGHTNAAVDNILVGLARKGRSIVRVGVEEKVRLECRPYVLGGEKAAEPFAAEVILATCIGSGDNVFQREGIRCHTVLIDECSQATETSCLVPICQAAQQVILVGDQCQLEPMIKSDFIKADALGNSLFNRLCQQGIEPMMLDTQYRMHPSICEFPSEAFYHGQLLSGVSRVDRTPTTYWKWPSPTTPVCFIDAQNGWESEEEGKIEKKNEHEVEIVLSVIQKLVKDPKLTSLREEGTYSIGVVTPYAAQKELISGELQRQGFTDDKGRLLIEVNSVDGFQGREKDVIVFSAVRSNSQGDVGFLHNWRRMNVMLTRAKHGLIVIGNRETLSHDEYWRNWITWAASRGCIRGMEASGKWTSKCLIDEDWVVKPKEHCTQASKGNGFNSDSENCGNSKAKAHVQNGKKSIPDVGQQPVDSWDDGFDDLDSATQQKTSRPCFPVCKDDGCDGDPANRGSSTTNALAHKAKKSAPTDVTQKPECEVDSWEDDVEDLASTTQKQALSSCMPACKGGAYDGDSTKRGSSTAKPHAHKAKKSTPIDAGQKPVCEVDSWEDGLDDLANATQEKALSPCAPLCNGDACDSDVAKRACSTAKAHAQKAKKPNPIDVGQKPLCELDSWEDGLDDPASATQEKALSPAHALHAPSSRDNSCDDHMNVLAGTLEDRPHATPDRCTLASIGESWHEECEIPANEPKEKPFNQTEVQLSLNFLAHEGSDDGSNEMSGCELRSHEKRSTKGMSSNPSDFWHSVTCEMNSPAESWNGASDEPGQTLSATPEVKDEEFSLGGDEPWEDIFCWLAGGNKQMPREHDGGLQAVLETNLVEESRQEEDLDSKEESWEDIFSMLSSNAQVLPKHDGGLQAGLQKDSEEESRHAEDIDSEDTWEGSQACAESVASLDRTCTWSRHEEDIDTEGSYSNSLGGLEVVDPRRESWTHVSSRIAPDDVFPRACDQHGAELHHQTTFHDWDLHCSSNGYCSVWIPVVPVSVWQQPVFYNAQYVADSEHTVPASTPSNHEQVVANSSSQIAALCWRLDEREIRPSSCRAISPSFAMTLPEYPTNISFKLMVHPYGSRSFQRPAHASIKVKCESNLTNMTHGTKMQIRIQVGGEMRGPFLHDFSSGAVAELPRGQDRWNLTAAVEATSKCVPIMVQVVPLCTAVSSDRECTLTRSGCESKVVNSATVDASHIESSETQCQDLLHWDSGSQCVGDAPQMQETCDKDPANASSVTKSYAEALRELPSSSARFPPRVRRTADLTLREQIDQLASDLTVRPVRRK
jgi:hypothetical protein